MLVQELACFLATKIMTAQEPGALQTRSAAGVSQTPAIRSQESAINVELQPIPIQEPPIFSTGIEELSGNIKSELDEIVEAFLEAALDLGLIVKVYRSKQGVINFLMAGEKPMRSMPTNQAAPFLRGVIAGSKASKYTPKK